MEEHHARTVFVTIGGVLALNKVIEHSLTDLERALNVAARTGAFVDLQSHMAIAATISAVAETLPSSPLTMDLQRQFVSAVQRYADVLIILHYDEPDMRAMALNELAEAQIVLGIATAQLQQRLGLAVAV